MLLKLFNGLTRNRHKTVNKKGEIYINKMLEVKATSMEMPEISIAFLETSSKSLSGVETRNSGSQVFRLLKTKEMLHKKLETMKCKLRKI